MHTLSTLQVDIDDDIDHGHHTNIHAILSMKTPFKSSTLDAAMQMFSEDKGTSQHVPQLRGTNHDVVYKEMMNALNGNAGTVVVSFADSSTQLLAVCAAAVRVVVESPTKISERLGIIMPQGCGAKLQLLRWMWPQKATLTLEQVMASPMFYMEQITGNPADVVDGFLPSPFERFKKNGKLDIDALLEAHGLTESDDPDNAIAIMSATLRLAQSDVEDENTRARRVYAEVSEYLLYNCDPPIPTKYRKPAREFGGNPLEIQHLIEIAEYYDPTGKEKNELKTRWIEWLKSDSRGTWRRSNKSSRRPDTQPGGLAPGEQPRKRGFFEYPLLPGILPHSFLPNVVAQVETAVDLKSINEMYAVLQDMYGFPATTDNETLLKVLELRDQIVEHLAQGTVPPVPTRFTKSDNVPAWVAAKEHILLILDFWEDGVQDPDVHSFREFIQSDEKTWGPTMELDEDIRTALRNEDIGGVYDGIEKLWLTPTTPDNEALIVELKEYIRHVLTKRRATPPVPQTYEKSTKTKEVWIGDAPAGSMREYLCEIVGQWLQEHPNSSAIDKAAHFVSFLNDTNNMSWNVDEHNKYATPPPS